MNFVKIFSGDFLDCLLMGSCSLFQENEDFRDLIKQTIRKNYKNRIDFINLIKINVIINFSEQLGNYKKYVYLRESNNIYSLLSIDGKTYFNELFNIENILPLEINEKISQYFPENIKEISPFYNDLAEKYVVVDGEENKNPDYVRNIKIMGNVQVLPKRADNVMLYDSAYNLEDMIITNSLYSTSGGTKMPKMMKILYSLEHINDYSDFLNLTELFTIFTKDMKFPPQLKKLSIYLDRPWKFKTFIKVIPKTIENLSIYAKKFRQEDILDFSHLKLKSFFIRAGEEFKNQIKLNDGVKNVEIWENFNCEYPKSIEKLILTYSDDTQQIIKNLDHLVNCKDLSILCEEKIKYPPNLEILRIKYLLHYIGYIIDLTNTKIKKIYIENMSYRGDYLDNLENLGYLKNFKLPSTFENFEINKNNNIDIKEYDGMKINYYEDPELSITDNFREDFETFYEVEFY